MFGITQLKIDKMLLKEQFFPTTVYGKDLQLDNNTLAQHIIQWSQQGQGLKKTNMNGWHSTTDMHTKPEYKMLVDELYQMQHEIFQEEWLDRKPMLGNMWANINYSGGYNRPHVHPNCLFSGVYYVKTQPQCGELVVEDPRPGIQIMLPIRKPGQPPKLLPRMLFSGTAVHRARPLRHWRHHTSRPEFWLLRFLKPEPTARP